MGKKRTSVTPNEAEPEQSLTWRLSDRGMDLLERAGLAGLYMALRAAAEAGADLSPLLWREDDLKPDAVTVHWTGPAKLAFVKLMEWAWQVRDGVLYLPAVHDNRERAQWWLRVPMHNGIFNTVLQHDNIQPKDEVCTRIVRLDENREIRVDFKPPILWSARASRNAAKKGKPQPTKASVRKLLTPWQDITGLFEKGKLKTRDVRLSKWVYPGIAGRYGDEEAWVGNSKVAILLMLAPTVLLYQRLQEKGHNWVTVVPDIHDLAEFDALRRRTNLDLTFTDIASLGDAGIRFVSDYSTRAIRREAITGCQVLALGKVSYYGKRAGRELSDQSIRRAVLDVPADLLSARRYRLLHRELPNLYDVRRVDEPESSPNTKVQPRKSKGKKATKAKKAAEQDKPNDDTVTAAGFFRMPSTRCRIADNLVNGRPWYTDLSIPLIWDHEEADRERKKLGGSLERAWFRAICRQRSKLMKLIQEEDMWDNEAEKIFVKAFWEAMDSLYAQEGKATERGGTRTAEDRFGDLNDELRRRITQARTRALLRSVLADVFAKAGRQKSIRAHPAAVWRLIDHPDHWRKGRDLALLALASHRNKEEREPIMNTEKGA